MSGSRVICQVSPRLRTVLSHVSVQKRAAPSLCVQAAPSSSSAKSDAPFISAEPRTALYDEDVKILLRNFPPNERVTLIGQAVKLSSKIIFASCGHFVTSSSGQVDVTTDESQGGTFTGVEPMGILWSLRTAPGQPNTRMAINFTDRPCVVTVHAYLGHLSLDDIYGGAGKSSHLPVAETWLERSYRALGVTRIEVEVGNIRGALYLPPGNGPFQGVIDMFGSSGGLIEYRSALLASRGFAALSLAYFRYKDLQSTFYDLKYEYFEEAIDWLTSHPKVGSNGVGVVAVSKGVENALIMGAYSPKVTGVVAINGFCYATGGNYLRNGETFLRAGE